MLLPKKVKHRKWQKGSYRGKDYRGAEINFGKFGLRATEISRISSRQLEAARRALTRHLKKEGKVWIRIFPHKPITNKGVEVPMGGGKGDVTHFVAIVKPGRIIFEIDGVDEAMAKEGLRKAANKLPVKTKFIKTIY